MKALRVLVVDDNVDSAEMVALLARMGGHEAQVTESGEGALSAVESFLPDAVFLDIGLPDIDGYELARRLRRLPGLGTVYIVATTGFSGEEDKQQAREAGIDHFLTKPIDPDVVEQLLTKLAS